MQGTDVWLPSTDTVILSVVCQDKNRKTITYIASAIRIVQIAKPCSSGWSSSMPVRQ